MGLTSLLGKGFPSVVIWGRNTSSPLSNPSPMLRKYSQYTLVPQSELWWNSASGLSLCPQKEGQSCLCLFPGKKLSYSYLLKNNLYSLFLLYFQISGPLQLERICSTSTEYIRTSSIQITHWIYSQYFLLSFYEPHSLKVIDMVCSFMVRKIQVLSIVWKW